MANHNRITLKSRLLSTVLYSTAIGFLIMLIFLKARIAIYPGSFWLMERSTEVRWATAKMKLIGSAISVLDYYLNYLEDPSSRSSKTVLMRYGPDMSRGLVELCLEYEGSEMVDRDDGLSKSQRKYHCMAGNLIDSLLNLTICSPIPPPSSRKTILKTFSFTKFSSNNVHAPYFRSSLEFLTDFFCRDDTVPNQMYHSNCSLPSTSGTSAATTIASIRQQCDELIRYFAFYTGESFKDGDSDNITGRWAGFKFFIRRLTHRYLNAPPIASLAHSRAVLYDKFNAESFFLKTLDGLSCIECALISSPHNSIRHSSFSSLSLNENNLSYQQNEHYHLTHHFKDEILMTPSSTSFSNSEDMLQVGGDGTHNINDNNEISFSSRGSNSSTENLLFHSTDNKNDFIVSGFTEKKDKHMQICSPQVPIVILFGPNAAFLEHGSDWMNMYLEHAGCDVLLMNYRGYGRSTGCPSPSRCAADAVQIMECIVKRGYQEIGIHGRSIGGIAASAAASSQYAKYVKWIVIDRSLGSLDVVAKSLVGWVASTALKVLGIYADNATSLLMQQLRVIGSSSYSEHSDFVESGSDIENNVAAYKVMIYDPDDHMIKDKASMKVGIASRCFGVHPMEGIICRKDEESLNEVGGGLCEGDFGCLDTLRGIKKGNQHNSLVQDDTNANIQNITSMRNLAKKSFSRLTAMSDDEDTHLGIGNDDFLNREEECSAKNKNKKKNIFFGKSGKKQRESITLIEEGNQINISSLRLKLQSNIPISYNYHDSGLFDTTFSDWRSKATHDALLHFCNLYSSGMLHTSLKMNIKPASIDLNSSSPSCIMDANSQQGFSDISFNRAPLAVADEDIMDSTNSDKTCSSAHALTHLVNLCRANPVYSRLKVLELATIGLETSLRNLQSAGLLDRLPCGEDWPFASDGDFTMELLFPSSKESVEKRSRRMKVWDERRFQFVRHTSSYKKRLKRMNHNCVYFPNVVSGDVNANKGSKNNNVDSVDSVSQSVNTLNTSDSSMSNFGININSSTESNKVSDNNIKRINSSVNLLFPKTVSPALRHPFANSLDDSKAVQFLLDDSKKDLFPIINRRGHISTLNVIENKQSMATSSLPITVADIQKFLFTTKTARHFTDFVQHESHTNNNHCVSQHSGTVVSPTLTSDPSLNSLSVPTIESHRSIRLESETHFWRVLSFALRIPVVSSRSLLDDIVDMSTGQLRKDSYVNDILSFACCGAVFGTENLNTCRDIPPEIRRNLPSEVDIFATNENLDANNLSGKANGGSVKKLLKPASFSTIDDAKMDGSFHRLCSEYLSKCASLHASKALSEFIQCLVKRGCFSVRSFLSDIDLAKTLNTSTISSEPNSFLNGLEIESGSNEDEIGFWIVQQLEAIVNFSKSLHEFLLLGAKTVDSVFCMKYAHSNKDTETGIRVDNVNEAAEKKKSKSLKKRALAYDMARVVGITVKVDCGHNGTASEADEQLILNHMKRAGFGFKFTNEYSQKSNRITQSSSNTISQQNQVVSTTIITH